jgi:hypothetical protein
MSVATCFDHSGHPQAIKCYKSVKEIIYISVKFDGLDLTTMDETRSGT